ncbi:MAG: hypothetical protein SV487_08610 [Thermodesulfobacteriota bacterium]|nr:hypothetical protein [Thermodesulfobacteriota bacterium]
MKKTIILAICSFLAAISINLIDKTLNPLVLREEVKFVPKTEISELLSLDHRGFLADMYFIQVSLHSGSLMWKPLKFKFDSPWAYEMMDVITDLDPKYYVAYLFAGMGLIHNFDDVKRAKPIIEKGMAVFPYSWELPFWIGYDYYVYFEDNKTASTYLWQAAQKPSAPKHFLSLMLAALKKTGEYEKAFWAMKTLWDSAKNEKRKTVYAKKMIQLKNLALLQKAAQVFREKSGRFPAGLDELLISGIIKKIPEDPYGAPYEWDAKKKIVVVKKEKKKKGAD